MLVSIKLSIKMGPIQNMTRYNPTPLHTPNNHGPLLRSFHPPKPLPSGNETGRDAANLLGAIGQMRDVTLERPAF